jgi:2-oxoacid:acceptor oxidoreductase gamma subunit (pyruvate/2-ketoisovalerate family)
MNGIVSSNPYMAMYDRVVNRYSGEYDSHFKSYKAKTKLSEVILIGRGGEGIWLSGEVLAATAIESGKYSKVIFRMPGERRSTPTFSYLRVADEAISFPTSFIYSADDILLFEEDMFTYTSVIFDMDIPTVACRMNPEGLCVVNSAKSPSELSGDLAGKLVTVDGTRISEQYLGTPFYMNFPVIGAYLAAKKSKLMKQMETTIKNFRNPRGHKLFEGKLGDLNIKALRAGYESAKF